MRGFSLLELLLVLVILSLLMFTVAPLLTHSTDGARLQRAQREIISALRFSRSRAVNTQQVVTFSIDALSGNMQAGNEQRRLSLPAQVDLSVQVAPSEQLSEHESAVRFYPDGSATGMTLLFERGGQAFRIHVDSLTGRISRHAH